MVHTPRHIDDRTSLSTLTFASPGQESAIAEDAVTKNPACDLQRAAPAAVRRARGAPQASCISRVWRCRSCVATRFCWRAASAGATSSDGRPATEHTVFAIGSTTKTFAATLLGMLAEEGKLDFDEPVSRVPAGVRARPTHASRTRSRCATCCRTEQVCRACRWSGAPAWSNASRAALHAGSRAVDRRFAATSTTAT